MPLAKGKSNKTVSKNIQTLVDDYQKSGRIGTSKPANKKAAIKQATAIALQKAGRSKPKKFAAGGPTAEPDYSDEREKRAYQAQLIAALAPSTDMPTTAAPKFAPYSRTRPNLKFTIEDIDVTRPLSRSTKAQEQKAMKKGGKVSVKKRRA